MWPHRQRALGAALALGCRLLVQHLHLAIRLLDQVHLIDLVCRIAPAQLVIALPVRIGSSPESRQRGMYQTWHERRLTDFTDTDGRSQQIPIFLHVFVTNLLFVNKKDNCRP